MGVIGLGHFAQVAILPAFRQLDDVDLVALVSGTRAKRRALGKRYAVADAIDYDELPVLLARGGVDAMYIALPPDLHAPYAIACARAGVHVLCEKPMAPSERECRDMITAAEAAGIALMIGYRLHFEAANLTATQLIDDDAVGRPRLFSAVFTLQVRPGNIRVQPRPGAGPAWDLAIYCINAARYLFRAEPSEITAIAASRDDDPRFENVDEQLAALLRFPGGATASFIVGFGAHDRAHCEVVGTDGVITLDNAFEYTEPIRLTAENGARPTRRTFARRDQIGAEIAYFARCIRDGVEPEPSGYEGLADVRIIEAVLRSAASGRVEPLEPIDRPRRPDIGQEIYVPPHGVPRLVGVESGSQ